MILGNRKYICKAKGMQSYKGDKSYTRRLSIQSIPQATKLYKRKVQLGLKPIRYKEGLPLHLETKLKTLTIERKEH